MIFHVRYLALQIRHVGITLQEVSEFGIPVASKGAHGAGRAIEAGVA